jgi:adenylate cyclase
MMGQPPPGLPLSASQYAHVLWLMDMALYASLAFIAVLVVIKVVQMVLGQFRPRVSVTYNSGDRKIAPAGLTLLEISRLSRVPHASMCGGRARCSTCRVQVLNGLEFLEPPARTSKWPSNVPGSTPLTSGLPARCAHAPTFRWSRWCRRLKALRGTSSLDRYQTGVERDITIMFVDIRGFTRFSDGRLPYDIVFILNQYLGRMSDAIIAKGGYVDKFMGDGIMALFGMETGEAAGARAALAAAAGVSKAVAELNKGHVADLSEPMRIGIGIHTGECILGRIGSSALHEAGDRITALGDTVNTASRLEGHSKSLGVEVVVSQSTLDAAGIAADQAELTSVEVRGKEQTVPCLALKRPTILRACSAATNQPGRDIRQHRQIMPH